MGGAESGGISRLPVRFDRRVAPNVAMLVPHGTVRMAVMGLDDRAPTAEGTGSVVPAVAGFPAWRPPARPWDCLCPAPSPVR